MQNAIPIPKWKKITLFNEETKTRKEFTQKTITIGRSKDRNFRLTEENIKVSGNHCSIIQDKSGVRVQDDNSMNGTHVNKRKKLSKGESTQLKNGDKILLWGYTLEVLFEDEVLQTKKITIIKS